MKKMPRFWRDFFKPDWFNDLDTSAVGEAMNDASVRRRWLEACFEELRHINQQLDRRLLSGSESGIIDLCARRKAYQDVLEAVLTARRNVVSGMQDKRHNPPSEAVNLDRVTV